MPLANFVGEDGYLGCLQKNLEVRLVLLTLQDHARELGCRVQNLLLLAFEDSEESCQQRIYLGACTALVVAAWTAGKREPVLPRFVEIFNFFWIVDNRNIVAYGKCNYLDCVHFPEKTFGVLVAH